MKIRFDCMRNGSWRDLFCWLRGYHQAVILEVAGGVQTCWDCGATRIWEPT